MQQLIKSAQQTCNQVTTGLSQIFQTSPPPKPLKSQAKHSKHVVQSRTRITSTKQAIAGVWSGVSQGTGGRYDITLTIKQNGNVVSGFCITTGESGRCKRYVHGSYDSHNDTFICKDIGIADENSISAEQHFLIDRYEFHLVDDGHRLVGSYATSSQNAKAWFTLDKKQTNSSRSSPESLEESIASADAQQPIPRPAPPIIRSTPAIGRPPTGNALRSNIAGTWRGTAFCEGQEYLITLDLVQHASGASGSLICNGDGGTSTHFLSGAFNESQQCLEAFDVSVDMTGGQPGWYPKKVESYQLFLKEGNTKLIGSAQQSNSKLWLTLIKETPATSFEATVPAFPAGLRTQEERDHIQVISNGLNDDPSEQNPYVAPPNQSFRTSSYNNVSTAANILTNVARAALITTSAMVPSVAPYALLASNLLMPRASSYSWAQSSSNSSTGYSWQAPTQFNTPVIPANTPDYFPSTTAAGIHRWPKDALPIKVYIASGVGVRGFRQSFRQMMINSFDDWMQAVGHKLSYVLVMDEQSADIVCNWVDTRQEFHTHVGNIQGETMPTFMPTGNNEATIQHADIKICTKPIHGSNWLEDRQMKATCLHEIGHALGLEGHSPNPGDVMFPTSYSHQLSSGDKATIVHLYSSNLPEIANQK